MNSPLPELLAEFRVDVVDSGISDAGFTGGAFVRKDGSLLLARPTGRPTAEWEIAARALLGQALRVPLPPLPSPFQVTEL